MGVSKIASDIFIKEITSGLLRPSELRSDSRSDVSTPKPTAALHRVSQPSIESHPSHANFSIDYTAFRKGAPINPLDGSGSNTSQTSQMDSPVHFIYDKFLEAVSKSLLFQITTTGDWLPLGHRSLIGPLPSPNLENWMRDVDLCQAIHGLKVFSLHVELLQSSTLLAACSPAVEYKIFSLYDALKNGQYVNVGRDVLLAPSGSTYSYDGVEDTQPSIGALAPSALHSESLRTLNPENLHGADGIASTIQQLAQQGIHVPQGEPWIRLRPKRSLAKHIVSAPLLSKTRSKTVVWPARLCFAERREPAIEDMDLTYVLKLSEKVSLNPLVNAEMWFQGKSAREESIKAIIEARRKASELEARIEESRCPDEPDSQSETETRVNQYLSTQDASRIYPTPPDVLRSEALLPQGVPEHQATSARPEDNIMSSAWDDGAALSESRLPTSPGFGASTNRYDHTADDDLFGEIDTGVFATSNLTEADFSFFDEPSEDDEAGRGIGLDTGERKQAVEMSDERSSPAVAPGSNDVIKPISGHSFKVHDGPRNSVESKPMVDRDQRSIMAPPSSF